MFINVETSLPVLKYDFQSVKVLFSKDVWTQDIQQCYAVYIPYNEAYIIVSE